MTYRQDKIPRDCSVCGHPIEEGDWMMDFFRDKPNVGVAWAHETCCRILVGNYIRRTHAANPTK